MTRLHRSTLARLRSSSGRNPTVTVIDTPYGFQSNADAITADAVAYFDTKLGVKPTVATLRRADADAISLETAYAAIRDADFLFSGPGSPSYALKQWAATSLPAILRARLPTPGALVFASAAALALGRVTIPVYELFKAGDDPYWLPGLDVLSAIGITAAVVPHYDNGEGEDYDTRFCFIGADRLEALEQQLPESVFILGIDEHTALVLDLDADTASVHGRGAVTIRRAGQSERFTGDDDLPIELLNPSSHSPAAEQIAAPAAATDDTVAILMGNLVALQAETDGLRRKSGLADALVQTLLDLRQQARGMAAYDVADAIRDQLVSLGIELMDRADGSTNYRIGGEGNT